MANYYQCKIRQNLLNKIKSQRFIKQNNENKPRVIFGMPNKKRPTRKKKILTQEQYIKSIHQNDPMDFANNLFNMFNAKLEAMNAKNNEREKKIIEKLDNVLKRVYHDSN